MNLTHKVLISVIQSMPRSVVRVFAGKYIAGDKLSDAISTVRTLNSRSLMATLDVLGESITKKEEAERCKDENLVAVTAIDDNKLDCNLSIKLTMLGLDIDYELCLQNTMQILAKAKSLNRFVRIDMEDSSVTEKTIRIFEDCRKEYDNVGIVLQAYLKRSHDDVIRLTQEKANFRLCKGIYIEPEEIAYKNPDEIRSNFVKLIRTAFERKAYVGIATHDEKVIKGSMSIVSDLSLKREEYEFQMLLGVREGLRDRLVREGHRLRVYVPFGDRWYEYSMRRFKENPNLAGQIIKSILSGN